MAEMGAITTGVDQLAALINSMNRVSVDEAAQKLHVSTQTIEEWAALLEEAGLITIEYALTKVYLVKRALSPKEQAKKAEELAVEKHTFETRSEGMLSYLDRFEEQVKKMQELIGKVNIAKVVPSEARILKNLEAQKEETDRQLVEAQAGLLKKMRKLDMHLKQDEQKVNQTFTAMLKELVDASHLIDLERKELGMIQVNERARQAKLRKLSKLLDQRVASLMRRKSRLVGQEKKDAIALARQAQRVRQELLTDRKRFESLMQESKRRRTQLERMHIAIIGKMRKHRALLYGKSPEQVRRFLAGRVHLADMLNKVYHEEQMLKERLMALIGKGKALHGAQNAGFEKELAHLNEDLSALTERRTTFEKDLRKIVEKLA